MEKLKKQLEASGGGIATAKIAFELYQLHAIYGEEEEANGMLQKASQILDTSPKNINRRYGSMKKEVAEQIANTDGDVGIKMPFPYNVVHLVVLGVMVIATVVGSLHSHFTYNLLTTYFTGQIVLAILASIMTYMMMQMLYLRDVIMADVTNPLPVLHPTMIASTDDITRNALTELSLAKMFIEIKKFGEANLHMNNAETWIRDPRMDETPKGGEIKTTFQTLRKKMAEARNAG